MNLPHNFATTFLLAVLLLLSGFVSAEESGNSNDTNVKVAAIIVNLPGPTQQFIQVEMTLKLASPEIAEKVRTYMPVIRHKMILLLSGKDAEQLRLVEGKKKLVQESKNAINQALDLKEKEGVSEVLFTSFLIQ